LCGAYDFGGGGSGVSMRVDGRAAAAAIARSREKASSGLASPGRSAMLVEHAVIAWQQSG